METNRFKLITPNDLDDYHKRAGEITAASWPEFMLHDPVADEYWHELFDRFSNYQFALLDTETNRMAAMANSLPFCWNENISNLPEGGWDWVFVKAVEDHKNGITPTIQSAILIKPCHEAMTMRGTRSEWESWTGLKFPQSGPYVIPGALNPMEMDIEKDEGVYIEPNVWMVHEIS